MQTSDFEHFRDVLVERQQNLMDWLNSSASVRFDDKEKVQGLMGQIKDALTRVELETFGKCTFETCLGEIERHRLEVQPVSQVCLDCISPEEKTELEEDLFLASKIHRALLPQTMPQIDGFKVDVRSLAAKNIGGDYYDFLPGAGGRKFRVVIADVMGHGLPAGLLMSNLQGAIRILSTDIESPAPLVERLNKWLCRNVPVTKFVSLACLSLEKTDGKETKVTYTNAGHCPPIVVRKDGSIERLDATGGVLGVLEEFTYEERSLSLFPGDSLMLYTDGIVEAANGSGEQFEDDRLIDFIKAQRGEPFENILDRLVDEVLVFTGNTQAADDLTALILRKK